MSVYASFNVPLPPAIQRNDSGPSNPANATESDGNPFEGDHTCYFPNVSGDLRSQSLTLFSGTSPAGLTAPFHEIHAIPGEHLRASALCYIDNWHAVAVA